MSCRLNSFTSPDGLNQSFRSGVLGGVRRAGGLLSVVAFALSMGGCALFPGMYASYSKMPEVKASAEEPDELNYQLFQVTPLLIKELQDEVKAAQFSVEGQLPVSKRPSYPYRLGPQDVVSISVWGYGEFGGQTIPNTDSIGTVSSTAGAVSSGGRGGRVVDPNGFVFLPLTGKVKAAGLTVDEFRRELVRRLSAVIKDPQVEVDVSAYRSQKVFVAGEVGRPGVVPITDQPLTLVDALSQVGGPTDEADYYDVRLTRGGTRVRLNIDRLYFEGDTSVNLLLQDGDVVSVPDRLDRKVFILGEVGNIRGANESRAYVMRRGRMTLTEVLADAGGINPFSGASSEVYVLRADPNIISPTQAARNPIVYKLNANNPESLILADQFPMQARDVVFVNPTGPTVIGRFIAQFLPIYGSAVSVSNSPF
jgi:polysaccharide export outer membrane protein